jgi:pimeloyl-ACP methyl ester carboxylesterase
MNNVSFFLRYRVKNPFRRILSQYIRYKMRYLRKNDILPYTYMDDEFTIHYHYGGKGPVLLFIHGFALDGMMNWVDVVVPFSRHFTIIVPDLLWFGKSSSTQAPSLTSQRKAMETLLRDLGVEKEKVNVIGQSYGGFVAVDLAMKNPGLIDKLIVANSPGTTFDESTLEPLLKKNSVNTISDLFVMKDGLDIKRLIHITSYKKPYFPEFLLKQLYKHFFSNHHEKWRILLDSLPEEKKQVENDPVDPLHNCNVLVLWGEHDELFIRSEGEKFARLIRANFAVIPGAGHAPQLDNMTEFIRVIRQFLIGPSDK